MKVLMCPPTYFSIDYEINPWMDKNKQVNRKLAQKQWESLSSVYQGLGVEVKTIEPVENLPDMVFTANGGLVLDNKVILANFRYQQRRPESAYFANWFENEGYEVVKLGPSEYFEGQGEALWLGEKLAVGYGFRANLKAHERLRQYLGDRLISVKIVDPRFYHLDIAFLPLDAETAAYFPGAFDANSRRTLSALIPNLIPVSKDDALGFACNNIVIGKNLIMPAGAVDLPKKLKNLGYEVIQVDISEFKKSGGGIRCLTLDLEPQDLLDNNCLSC